MKKKIDLLDATPSKRLFLSIIADYDMNRSICELVDNGLDVWVRNGKKKEININIILNERQQNILVIDNAGGLPKSELKYIVGPGQTSTNPTDETIGIFGVGTKRAVVALAQEIRIKTRFKNEKTYQIEFDDNWLEEDDWQLPIYEVDNIDEETTIVELQKLRIQITEKVITQLKEHLGSTYARFLNDNSVIIKINDDNISPIFFENWAFPPDYPPHKYIGILKTEDNKEIQVEAYAGLIRESSPSAGEYGVYFYCNDRLIVRALKTFDVGFTKGFAGLPHPKVSLTRVLVFLKGNAISMPWNSSKSDISTKHDVFLALHDWLVQVVKDFASLSRIWMGNWPEKVFKHKTGTIIEIKIKDFPKVRKSYLPPLPKSKLRYVDIVTKKNKSIANRKPWIKGLYESIIATDIILKQHLEQRNRIALILLDSTLEIAFKEYLVNESGNNYNDQKLLSLFKNRTDVQNEIKNYVKIKKDTWSKIDHYYRLRCKLIHERATVGIHDNEIKDFREVVEKILSKLYKLKFGED